MRGLVVDDLPDVRKTLSKILLHLGIDADTAEDGLSAVSRLRSSICPDFVFVDWNMPEMDGLQFVKHVRSKPEYAGMRLIMVTGENELDQVVVALDAGADEYVMKPFSVEIIADKLALLGLLDTEHPGDNPP